MSKLARKPIPIPDGVQVNALDGTLSFSGKAGKLSVPILEFISVELKDKEAVLTQKAVNKQSKANWGTMASLFRNAIIGVSQGFERKLEIEGEGFKAQMEGEGLILNVGFTHTVKFQPPEGIKIEVQKNVIKVSGIDKRLVGQSAAKIRKIKKPEPYKGKGIHN